MSLFVSVVCFFVVFCGRKNTMGVKKPPWRRFYGALFLDVEGGPFKKELVAGLVQPILAIELIGA